MCSVLRYSCPAACPPVPARSDLDLNDELSFDVAMRSNERSARG